MASRSLHQEMDRLLFVLIVATDPLGDVDVGDLVVYIGATHHKSHNVSANNHRLCATRDGWHLSPIYSSMRSAFMVKPSDSVKHFKWLMVPLVSVTISSPDAYLSVYYMSNAERRK